MEFITYLGSAFGPKAAALGIVALALWAGYTKAVVPALDRRRADQEKRQAEAHEDRNRLLHVVEQNTAVMGQVTSSHSELAGAIRELRTDLTVNREKTESIARDVDTIRDAVNELKGRLH